MRRTRSGAIGLATIMVVSAGVTVAEAADVPVADPAGVGAPGVGDEYFPRAGNGGYDVGHYDLRLRYDPRVRPAARRRDRRRSPPDQRLTRFNLDLRRPLRVRTVKIDSDVGDVRPQAGRAADHPGRADRRR